MSDVQTPSPHESHTPREAKTSSVSNSSIARTRCQAESTADGTPGGQTSSHRRTPGPNRRRHVNAAIDSSGAVRKQVPVVWSVGSSTTGPARRADDIERGSEGLHFRKAVAIGEKLERELEMFLPLLEGVPPHFRSHSYHHGKTEFLNVKGILAGTVKTLKATPHGDVRVVASQYLLFKDMIYDNLRSLLLWLDEELEKYNETRKKGIEELLSESSSDPQVSSRSHPVTQPQLAGQSTEIMESSPVGELAKPKAQLDKRRSVFSQAVSSLPPIPNSPLNVEMPAPVGDASNFVTQDGIVKYASFSALISILTSPKPNPNIKHFDQLHDAFLLCFRCFSTPMHVVRALVARFQQGQPNNLTSEQERVWPLHMQAVRLRVVNVLRAWIDLYWVHEDDCPAVPLIQHFAESTIELRWPEASERIVQGLKRRLRESDHPSLCRDARHPKAPNDAALGVKIVPLTRRPSAVGLLDTYASSALGASSGEDPLNSAILADDLVRNDEFAHVLVFNSDQHCTELARQLTLFMSAEFRSVDPEKLLHHLCRQCRDCHTEKTINTLQLHASALQSWTAKSIVVQNEPETRAGVMTFLIALALRCRKLRNFGALCAIYSGLTFGFTERLSQESLPLPEATKSALQDLCHLVQEARNDFELSLDYCKPTVPPIGWFLEDFGSVNEERHHVQIPGMPKDILNIEMYCNAAQTVRSMEKCHIPYASVARAGRVQAWISKAFLDVGQQDLHDVRGWVESRCDVIERRVPPKAKKLFKKLSILFMRKEPAFSWARAEITNLIPELLPRDCESSA